VFALQLRRGAAVEPSVAREARRLLEVRVRHACRGQFLAHRLLAPIIGVVKDLSADDGPADVAHKSRTQSANHPRFLGRYGIRRLEPERDGRDEPVPGIVVRVSKNKDEIDSRLCEVFVHPRSQSRSLSP
jgi:hypothetical protein